MIKQNIEYVSTLQGSGKTFALVRCIVEDTSNFIHLVIMPTHKLCKNTAALLKRKFRDQRIVELIPEEGMRGNSSTTELITQLLSAQTNLATRSVVIMTHAAFMLLPKLERAREIKIYFDEAIKLVEGPIRIPIASKKDCQNIIDTLSDYAHMLSDANVALLRVPKEKQRLVRDNINKVSNYHSSKELAYSKLMWLVQIASDQDYAIYIKRVQTGISVFTVRRPRVLFKNFAHVVVASAGFEFSQMYHLMKNDKLLLLKDGFETKRFSRLKNRNRKILKRLSRLTIYCLQRENKNDPNEKISKGTLHQAVAVVEGTQQDFKNFINDVPPPLNERRNGNNMETTLNSMTRKITVRAIRSMHVSRNYKTTATRYEYEMACCWLTDNNGFIRPIDGLEWAAENLVKKLIADDKVKYSMEHRSTFEDRHIDVSTRDTKPRALFFVNNEFKDSTGEYKAGSNQRWSPLFVPVSGYPHGLNTFSSCNTAVYISANNPNKELGQFLRILLPDYFPDYDFAGASCAQAITRLCVRDINSTERAYAILPDWGLARIVSRLLSDVPKIRDTTEPTIAIVKTSNSIEHIRRRQSEGGKTNIKKKSKKGSMLRTELKKICSSLGNIVRTLKKDPANMYKNPEYYENKKCELDKEAKKLRSLIAKEDLKIGNRNKRISVK